MRFAIKRIEQGWSPDCEDRQVEPGEWGVLKLGSITTGRFREDANKALPSSLEPRREYTVRAGDVLVARASGSPALVGKACYVDRVTRHLLLSDKHYRIELRLDRYDPEYFVLALNSSASRTIIEQQLSSAEGMARNIGQNVIKNIWWSVPSLETQREVVSYLKRASAPIQSAEAKIQQSLARLDELRSSLITAAVTGKIDPATWGRRGMTERALASVGELS